MRHLLMEAHLQQDAARMTVEGMLWLMHGQHLVPLMRAALCAVWQQNELDGPYPMDPGFSYECMCQ